MGEMYLVSTRVGHPELRAWKYPLPGDTVVTTIQRVVIDVDTPHVVRFQMLPDQHRSTLCDDIACRGGEWSDVAVERRFIARGVRFDIARSQARVAAHRRCGERVDSGSVGRKHGDVLRIRKRARELAVSAGVE